MAEALQLQQDMLDFRNSFNQEIARILEQAPLKIRPRKVKVDLDAMETDATAANLPSPLQPQPAQANVVEATLASVASHSSELLSAGCENVENLAAVPPPADAQLASFPLPQTPQHVDVCALDSGTSKTATTVELAFVPSAGTIVPSRVGEENLQTERLEGEIEVMEQVQLPPPERREEP